MKPYQTPQFMADLLEKIQALQIAIVRKNDGHSLHVEANSHENRFYSPGYHILLNVTLFDGTSLVDSWDFSSMDDADILNHQLDDLKFKIGRL